VYEYDVAVDERVATKVALRYISYDEAPDTELHDTATDAVVVESVFRVAGLDGNA
jgi:hypothetical protein